MAKNDVFESQKQLLVRLHDNLISSRGFNLHKCVCVLLHECHLGRWCLCKTNKEFVDAWSWAEGVDKVTILKVKTKIYILEICHLKQK